MSRFPAKGVLIGGIVDLVATNILSMLVVSGAYATELVILTPFDRQARAQVAGSDVVATVAQVRPDRARCR